MNIPVDIIAAIAAVILASLITLQAFLIRRVFKLEARLALLIAVMQEHFGFRIPSGDTDHIRFPKAKA